MGAPGAAMLVILGTCSGGTGRSGRPSCRRRCSSSVERPKIAAPYDEARWVSRVRYSTLVSASSELLLAHSSFPTDDARSVVGLDSYRFAAPPDRPVRGARRCVDVGCGTGVGGLVLAGRVSELVLADVNPAALELAAVNAALSGVSASAISFVLSDVLAAVEGDIDLLIANPPYLVDEPGAVQGRRRSARPGARRAHRRGVAQSPATRGRSARALYGTPIVAGENLLAERLRPLRAARESTWTWCEARARRIRRGARAPGLPRSRTPRGRVADCDGGLTRASPVRPACARPRR